MGYNGNNRKLKSSMFSKRKSKADNPLPSLLTGMITAPFFLMDGATKNANTDAEYEEFGGELSNSGCILVGIVLLCLCVVTIIISVNVGIFSLFFELAAIILAGCGLAFLVLPSERRKKAKQQNTEQEK